MKKQPIKKKCPICNKVHYDNRSCIKKQPESNGIYNLVKEKKIYKQK